MSQAFIDTWAWVALVDKKDSDHEKAKNTNKMLNEMIDGGLVRLSRITEAHEKEAWSIFEKYSDRDFSYVDCTSFAVRRNMALQEAFTNDHHFRIMGFITRP